MADTAPIRSTPLSLWIFRALWTVLPVISGPAVSDGFSDSSRSVQIVSAVLAYGAWGLALTASLIPRTFTLTILRILAPGAGALAAWAAFAGDEPAWALGGLAVSLVALVTFLLPSTTDAFVDGSSYGAEQRVALATPAALVLGPIPLAVGLVGIGLVTGPLLLAAEQWIAGGLAVVVGLPVAAVAARRLHVLARRWLVFVPAGLVVHDPLTLSEPVLMQRALLESVGPATEGTDALDLTSGALGLVLEIDLREPIELGMRRGRDAVETTGVTGLLVAPHRPATALEIAADRRLPVA